MALYVIWEVKFSEFWDKAIKGSFCLVNLFWHGFFKWSIIVKFNAQVGILRCCLYFFWTKSPFRDVPNFTSWENNYLSFWGVYCKFPFITINVEYCLYWPGSWMDDPTIDMTPTLFKSQPTALSVHRDHYFGPMTVYTDMSVSVTVTMGMAWMIDGPPKFVPASQPKPRAVAVPWAWPRPSPRQGPNQLRPLIRVGLLKSESDRTYRAYVSLSLCLQMKSTVWNWLDYLHSTIWFQRNFCSSRPELVSTPCWKTFFVRHIPFTPMIYSIQYIHNDELFLCCLWVLEWYEWIYCV